MTNNDESASEIIKSITTVNAIEIKTQSNGAVNCLDVDNEHHRFLLSGGADSSIKIWDISDEAFNGSTGSTSKKRSYPEVALIPRRKYHSYGISAVQWYKRDSGLFVSSSFDHCVKIWDSENCEPVYSFDLDHRIYSIDMSSLSEQNSLIATATDHPLLRLIDIRTSSSTHTLQGHQSGGVLSVKWSPTVPYILASGGSDGTVRIWDIRQSKSCIGSLDCLNTNQPNYSSKVAKSFSHRGSVNSLLWLNDGTHLISTGTDDEIILWKVADGLSPNQTRSFNTLTNYGRLVSNRHPQTIYMSLIPEFEHPYFFFPSESGQILVFDALSGKIHARLNRPIPNGNSFLDISRSTCIACRGSVEDSKSFEYFSGASDGTITRWALREKLEDRYIKKKTEKRTIDQPFNSDSDSSESEYESVGNVFDRMKK